MQTGSVRQSAPPLRARARRWAEAHPYGALFLFAFALRAALGVLIVTVTPQLSFFDDGTYSQLALERINGESDQWDSYASWLYVHTGTLLWPLTLLYRVFGPSELLGPLLVAVFGAATATVTARLGVEALGSRRGLLVGLVVALLPSQVLISSVLAKDALTWFLLASLALVVALAAKAAELRRLVALAALAAALLSLLGLLRLHTMTVAAVALLLCAWFGTRTLRPVRIVLLAMPALFVPWVVGVGPAGLELIANHGSLEGTRAYHARGGSALEGVAPAPDPAEGGANAPGAAGAPGPGTPAAATPERTVRPDDEAGGVARNLAYLPRGVSVMLLEPVPWRSSGSAALRLASLESVVWYPIVVLAVVGTLLSWRRRAVLAFPILVSGALLCMWGLVEGNVGTAFRHRGEVVWAACLLAGFALATRQDRRSARRPAPDDEAPDDRPLVASAGSAPAR